MRDVPRLDDRRPPPDPLTTFIKEAVREAVREEFAALDIQLGQREDDRLVTAKEAGELLNVSRDWIYRHAHELPFTRRPTKRAVRFSYHGIQKWLKTR